MFQHIVAKGADRSIVTLRCLVGRCGVAWHFLAQLASLFDPLLATAVHNLGVGVAEELEYPEGVAGPPVVLVAVENDCRVSTDALVRHQLGKTL